MTSVSENHDPPTIATLGTSSCNGLHARKLPCDDLSNSGKPPLAVVIPSQALVLFQRRCRDLTAGSLLPI